MMRVLLTVSPKYWSGLSLRTKVRLAGCQLWYPLHMLVMLVMVLLPAWALFSHAPLVGVNVGAFYLHFAPVGLVLLTAVLLLRRRGLLRPATAPVISWESLLFRLVRWPWALIGCGSGLLGSLTGRENGFKVTPKRADDERPLPIRVLVPYLVLSAISILPVLLVGDPRAARGYYFWALLNGITYLLVSIAVVALHIAENRAHTNVRSIVRFAGVRSTVIATVAALLIFAAAVHGRAGLDGSSWPGHASVVMWYADWQHSAAPSLA